MLSTVVYYLTMDFQQIIEDLRAANYSDAHIAQLCGCTRQYIGKVGRGDTSKVGFEIGQKLKHLHEALG